VKIFNNWMTRVCQLIEGSDEARAFRNLFILVEFVSDVQGDVKTLPDFRLVLSYFQTKIISKNLKVKLMDSLK